MTQPLHATPRSGRKRSLKTRRRAEAWARGMFVGASLLAVAILVMLLARLLQEGTRIVLSSSFWTPYSPLQFVTGQTGVLDAVLSSLVVLGLTLVFAVPIGTAAGVYLFEYAGTSRLAEWIRAAVSNLAGVPSVVYGLLGLAVFVRMLGFGATNLASALTLAVLILPILIVATEEALKTVPGTVRRASLALGATKWQTIRSHVLPYALPGILTGQILALSRAAGETAPLLLLGIPTFTSAAAYGPMDAGTCTASPRTRACRPTNWQPAPSWCCCWPRCF
jgi:phosphate transport system permease protein